MATFELTGPDGGTYEVDAPNESAALSAFQQMTGGVKEPGIGVGQDLLDVAKAAPGRTVAGIAGIPGDLLHLGMRALGDNLTPESAYGSRAIARSLGSDYEAKTEPGRVAQKTIDFAPAVLGGPETLGAKLLTRVAAPVAASEAGRAVAGPYGEVAGALMGAAGASAAANRSRAIPRAIPSGDDLLRTGGNQFDQARNMNVIVKPTFVDDTVNGMRAALKSFDPEGQKPVFSAVDRLEKLSLSSPSLPRTAVEMNDIENIRKQLSNLRMSSDGPTREAARSAMGVLTGKQAAITAADVVAGDAPLYAKTMNEAIGNYGAGKRSQIVSGKQELANLNASTAGSGANSDNAMRQAIKQLARPINNTNVTVAQRLGFNEAERDAIKKAATGTAVGNTARYLGKLAPTGSVSGVISGGAGFAAAGPVGMAALPAAGYLAKKIGDLSTKRAVAELDKLVRSRSPLAQQVAAQLPPAVVSKLPRYSKLLLATNSLRPIVSPQLVPQASQ